MNLRREWFVNGRGPFHRDIDIAFIFLFYSVCLLCTPGNDITVTITIMLFMLINNNDNVDDENDDCGKVDYGENSQRNFIYS